jgi:hypothetical protein
MTSSLVALMPELFHAIFTRAARVNKTTATSRRDHLVSCNLLRQLLDTSE